MKQMLEKEEEIITLDLNKPWPTRINGYSNYMDDVDRLSRKPRKQKNDFIQII